MAVSCYPTRWAGSHPVHETAVQKERMVRGRELVSAEVSLRGKKSGWVQMGTGVVHAAETSRLCFGVLVVGLMLIEAW